MSDERDVVERLESEISHLEANGMLQGLAAMREAAAEIRRLRSEHLSLRRTVASHALAEHPRPTTGSLAGEGERGLLSSIVTVVRDAIVHAQSNPEGATSPWPYGERILTKALTAPPERTEAVGYVVVADRRGDNKRQSLGLYDTREEAEAAAARLSDGLYWRYTVARVLPITGRPSKRDHDDRSEGVGGDG